VRQGRGVDLKYGIDLANRLPVGDEGSQRKRPRPISFADLNAAKCRSSQPWANVAKTMAPKTEPINTSNAAHPGPRIPKPDMTRAITASTALAADKVISLNL
jgi:hypothetical protein